MVMTLVTFVSRVKGVVLKAAGTVHRRHRLGVACRIVFGQEQSAEPTLFRESQRPTLAAHMD